jgi:hypothetical protein
MATTSGGETANASSATQAAEQLKAVLSSSDSTVTEGVQGLARVHQARLSQASRTAAALKVQYGADDPRVKAAEASVAATKTTIARVLMVHQQLTVPVVQVAKGGWALQGRVVDAQLQPAAKFTVFVVDAKKEFLHQYGFSYTDDTGYFLINYAGGQAASSTQLFIEVANTDANPVYLSSTAFQPVLGTASFQNIVLPAGGQPIGGPPRAIRKVAMPGKGTHAQPAAGPSEPSKP